MADTLTINLTPDAADRLRRLAADHGQSVEEFTRQLVEDATDELSHELSEDQLAELRRRVRDPGPIASPERTAEVLRKFGIDR